jgi:hypothetical protein
MAGLWFINWVPIIDADNFLRSLGHYQVLQYGKTRV